MITLAAGESITDVVTEVIDGLIDGKGLYCGTMVAKIRTVILRTMMTKDANATELL